MKQRKAVILKILLFVLSAIVITVCLYVLHNNRNVYEKTENVGVLTLHDEDELTFDMLEQMQEEYLIGGYQVVEGQKIILTGSVKSAETNLVIVNFPVTELLTSVNQLHVEDMAGCIVSSHTMYELFGTTESIGQCLTLYGRDYMVRGILDTEESMVMIQYDTAVLSDRNKALDGIVFDTSKELYRNQFVNHFYNSYQMGNVSDLYYTYDYMSLFGKLGTPVKWSDFDFWKDYENELAIRLERKLYGNKDVIELYYYHIFIEKLKTELILFFMCIVNFIILYKLLKMQEGKKA